jgi:hypothetical protein
MTKRSLTVLFMQFLGIFMIAHALPVIGFAISSLTWPGNANELVSRFRFLLQALTSPTAMLVIAFCCFYFANALAFKLNRDDEPLPTFAIGEFQIVVVVALGLWLVATALPQVLREGATWLVLEPYEMRAKPAAFIAPVAQTVIGVLLVMRPRTVLGWLAKVQAGEKPKAQPGS